MEWLRLFPNDGFFPQIAQIFDMAAEVYLRSPDGTVPN
jgi:hypothetical protein